MSGSLGPELKDRVALVIGGGSIAPGIGIGRAISMALAREGALVVTADRNIDAAQETASLVAASGGQCQAAQVDVLNDASIEQLIENVLAQHGRLDILHCNVGLGKSGPSDQTSPADWRRISDANLTSLHVASQAVLPTMRAQKTGVITVTSTIAAIRHVGYAHLAYGATKAAALHFTRALAVELAADGIRVNAIIAGLIDTPRIGLTLATAYGDSNDREMRAARDTQCPLGRMGSAWDIAEAAVFLASDRAGYITGTFLSVDGGLSATVRQPVDF